MERFAWHQFRYRGSSAGAWPNFRCSRPTASIVHRRSVSAIHFLGVTRHRSSPQGRAAALLFAPSGATVVSCDRKSDGLEETRELAEREGLTLQQMRPRGIRRSRYLTALPDSCRSRMSRKSGHRPNTAVTAGNVVTLGARDHGWCAAWRDNRQKVGMQSSGWQRLMEAQQMPSGLTPARQRRG